MKVLLLLNVVVSLANSGIITHYGGASGHGEATSYQNIQIDHFHPVPIYIRKEDLHLLENPVQIGKSSSNIEINHGGYRHVQLGAEALNLQHAEEQQHEVQDQNHYGANVNDEYGHYVLDGDQNGYDDRRASLDGDESQSLEGHQHHHQSYEEIPAADQYHR